MEEMRETKNQAGEVRLSAKECCEIRERILVLAERAAKVGSVPDKTPPKADPKPESE